MNIKDALNEFYEKVNPERIDYNCNSDEEINELRRLRDAFTQESSKYQDMIDMYEDALFTMNLADLKYNKSDAEKNEKTANKYENCIRHFFKNHKVILYPHKQEIFLLIY